MKLLFAGLVSALTLFLWMPWTSDAACVVEAPTAYVAGANLRDDKCDTGGRKKTTIDGYSFVSVAADTLVKTGAGILHTITCQSDAAATAGTIIVFDNTAESGTQIWSWTVSVVEYQPRTLIFDAAVTTGIFIGYTTLADVSCTVTFR